MDKEERELQIKLAQLSANIQIGLAWIFGLFGAALALLILGYQVQAENLVVTIASWTAALISMVAVFGWMQRVKGYSDELRKLQ